MAEGRVSDEQRTVGQLLRAYREVSGLTQKALAAQAGVGEQTIGYLERDLVLRPQRTTMKRLSAVLGLSAEQQESLERARRRQPPRPEGDADSPAEAPSPSTIDERAGPIVDLFVPPAGATLAAHLVTLIGPERETTAVALAAQALFGVRGYFNVYRVALTAGSTAARLPMAILAAIAPREAPPADTSALLDYLRAQHLLLILDRCEQLIDPCAVLIDAILQRCPSVCVLATCTEPLQIEGEIVRPITPRT